MKQSLTLRVNTEFYKYHIIQLATHQLNSPTFYGTGEKNGTKSTIIVNTVFRTGSGFGLGSGLEYLLYFNSIVFTRIIKNVFRTGYLKDLICINSGAVQGSGENTGTTFKIVTFTPNIKRVLRTGYVFVTFTSAINMAFRTGTGTGSGAGIEYSLKQYLAFSTFRNEQGLHTVIEYIKIQ